MSLDNKALTEQFLKEAQNENFDKEKAESIDKDTESEKLIRDETITEKNQENQHEELVSEANDVPEDERFDNVRNNQEKLLDGLAEKTESNSGSSEISDIEIIDTPDENEESEGTESKSDEKRQEQSSEWQDILGSGVVMKKVIIEGQPDSRPERASKLKINYILKLEDDTIIESGTDFEVRLGECDVVQGLDVALGLMNLNEKCTLKIEPRLGFGERGLPPNIPPGSTVVYEVELTSVEPEDEIELLSVQERRDIGNKKRERGNWWYQRGENTLAVQCYRRALDYLDEVESGMYSTVTKDSPSSSSQPTDSELQALLEDRLKVSNNMASAQIKMELYDQALLSLQTVLRCQPDNVKALFRKAKIHVAKLDLQSALKCLEKARALEPEDGLISKEINIVNGLIQKQKNSEREYARRMFGGASPRSSSSQRLTKEVKNEGPNGSRFQMWATLGATFFIGLAGAIIYKMNIGK